MILDTLPTPEEFYKTYWGKKPFIVRKFIPADVIDTLIDGDTLAGLALEEDIRSRFITNNDEGNDWSCEHGPLDEDHFTDVGTKNWSLLVQNVEQYHIDTAKLLSYFQFSPRWLLDDIMVSYSTVGGSVGPHTDSYHTFLVQGIGKREWKISADKIEDGSYAPHAEMKVLQNGFEGEVFEVSVGDVIYMPPFFGHEGKTIETAMTFSVGFLGPQLSEILGEYAQYLETNEDLNKRYLGNALDEQSAGFAIGKQTQKLMRDDAIASLDSDDFSRWLAIYFSTPRHEDLECLDEDETCLNDDELLSELKKGKNLYRTEQVKFSIVPIDDNQIMLAVEGEQISVSAEQSALINALNKQSKIMFSDIEHCNNQDEAIRLIAFLYHHKALML